MRIIWLITALSLTTMVTAAAAEPTPAPKVTKDFLAQCNASAECSDWISNANVTHLMQGMAASKPGGYCIPKAAYDDKGFTTESINRVTAWLAAQTDRADAPTQDSLAAAFPALWPETKACRAETDDDLPTVTGAFIGYCAHEDRKHKSRCEDVITDESIAVSFTNMTTICVPESATATDAGFKKQIGDVKAWLAAHTEVHVRSRSAGIKAAYLALYPCRTK